MFRKEEHSLDMNADAGVIALIYYLVNKCLEACER